MPPKRGVFDMLSLSTTKARMLSATLLALALTAPEVTLSGVVVSRSGRHAATLVSEGRARAVVTGDRVFGCAVSAVRETQVELSCDGAVRTLSLAAPPSVQSPRPLLETAPQAPPADLTIARVDLESRLEREMSRLMTETTLIPVTSRGQVAGFTLSRIPAGTILETLGLRAGDVLVNVNDTPIDSFTTLVGLWPRLQSSGALRAQIIRDGKPLDISVSIK